MFPVHICIAEITVRKKKLWYVKSDVAHGIIIGKNIVSSSENVELTLYFFAKDEA